MVRTGVSFAGAAGEHLRYVEHDLDRKPSTLGDYRAVIRAHLAPAFGALRLEDVTTVINGFLARARHLHRLPVKPMADIEKPRHRRSTATDVLSPEEVLALVREAASEQDAAIYLTAAFTGLRRGELVALRGRAVDLAAHRIRICGSYAGGQLTTPKSGKVRSVSLAPAVAESLARLGEREWSPTRTISSSRVRPAATSTPPRSHAGAESHSRAPTCRLRFHDLRHTFGTRMIAKADIRRVHEWMGHADVARVATMANCAGKGIGQVACAAREATMVVAAPRATGRGDGRR